MKKAILLFGVFFAQIFYGQFTISESSNDWEKVGSYWGNIFLEKKKDKARIKFKDQAADNFSPFDSFRTKRQVEDRKFDKALENIQEGRVAGFQVFEFSIEDDTLDKLWEIIEQHFETKTKEELKLDFKEGAMYLNFGRSFGMYSMRFGFEGRNGNKIYTQAWNKSNLRSIFNKKSNPNEKETGIIEP